LALRTALQQVFGQDQRFKDRAAASVSRMLSTPRRCDHLNLTEILWDNKYGAIFDMDD
jgi:hypothetical protein